MEGNPILHIANIFHSSVVAGVGVAFGRISPNKRPFSLVNPEISYPNVNEKISTITLILVSLFAPAIIILLASLFIVPGPIVPKGTSKSLIWRRKVWEWNTGWMGLGLSLAATFLIT